MRFFQIYFFVLCGTGIVCGFCPGERTGNDGNPCFLSDKRPGLQKYGGFRADGPVFPDTLLIAYKKDVPSVPPTSSLFQRANRAIAAAAPAYGYFIYINVLVSCSFGKEQLLWKERMDFCVKGVRIYA
ncbi:hypothetical protein DXA36_23455 [Eisenbergiella sp. OF01-20]|jgi:hypothetical protein|nr:hypothetical protein DXA36_23455 [Eisenbergiella sp. OF01-20]